MTKSAVITQDPAPSEKTQLRFLTCGSVDDGKSTLIGRILYDSHAVMDDQVSQSKIESARYGTQGDSLDLALLLDGLQAEREQGITIDVAYRFFETKSRKFIAVDTPGHEQYTRNMVTGASNVELAIILVDSQKGISKQTKRHSALINSMDSRCPKARNWNSFTTLKYYSILRYDYTFYNWTYVDMDSSNWSTCYYYWYKLYTNEIYKFWFN